jgi:predicted small integral membrane protein
MIETSKALRGCKIVLLASFAVYAALVAWGNFVDPATNLAFVEHVLRMDTTFGRPGLMSRAIENSTMHRLAFGVIVGLEITIAGLCGWGSVRLARTWGRDADAFHAAKAAGVLGLTLGLLLWFFGFQVVGGEWFASWQSATWNGLDSAGRVTGYLLGSLVFVSLRND